jgi:lipoprotein-anchoring transpeptidase ErfK/SrfK
MISRRLVLLGLAGAPLAACQTARLPVAGGDEMAGWYIGSLPDQPHPIRLVDRSKLRPELAPTTVAYSGGERPGTIVVDIDQRFLYLVQGNGRALRYGVGVGERGFSWKGVAYVGRKAAWPDWSPTKTMVRLKPKLARYAKGGIDNPLGSRALYLYQGSRDILFRIHGTNEPWTIGQQVSSGCIRMLNEDVVNLYNRVPTGTTVLVKRHGRYRV